MASWILVPCLVSLRNEFNRLSPNRDKGADGSIGDTAHSSSSDHTPDEDSNVLRDHDGDSKNEVHALDIDSTGPWPESFDAIVRRLVAREKAEFESATVVGRLKYVIWNRRIAERSNGWNWRAYTLADPHTNHAHFSARYTTAQESDTRPWGLLEELDMALDAADKKWIQEQLAPLKSTDATVNPIARIQIPDYAQPAANRRKVAWSTWAGYTDANRNADKGAVLKAIAALDRVDTAALVAALAPALAAAVLAGLPEDRDDVTPAELQDAIVGALKVLVERPPA